MCEANHRSTSHAAFDLRIRRHADEIDAHCATLPVGDTERTFRIKEKFTATGTFEVFNVLNYQNYGVYNTNVGIASYGRAAFNSNLAYAARMLQFSARLDF